jgi:hypothetical protein
VEVRKVSDADDAKSLRCDARSSERNHECPTHECANALAGSADVTEKRQNFVTLSHVFCTRYARFVR